MLISVECVCRRGRRASGMTRGADGSQYDGSGTRDPSGQGLSRASRRFVGIRRGLGQLCESLTGGSAKQMPQSRRACFFSLLPPGQHSALPPGQAATATLLEVGVMSMTSAGTERLCSASPGADAPHARQAAGPRQTLLPDARSILPWPDEESCSLECCRIRQRWSWTPNSVHQLPPLPDRAAADKGKQAQWT